MTVRVRLLGPPRVEDRRVRTDDDWQPHPRPRGQKTWAVLGRIGLAERPIHRRELAAEMFTEADDPLGALRWSLADLRRALGLPTALRGDPLQLERGEVWLDVWELGDGTLADADLTGQFLAGVELCDSPEFDSWLLLARSRCQQKAMEELRHRALYRLGAGDGAGAVAAAECAVTIDQYDLPAQELLLRALVADGRRGVAGAHLARLESVFLREGLRVPPTMRAAVAERTGPGVTGVRAAVMARSMLQAGRAALDAGAVDGGVETLRRAAEEATRADDDVICAEVLAALGAALVHAVRGYAGEGAVVLHRALAAARAGRQPAIAAEVLRELGFIDIQAGRHDSAARSLARAHLDAEDLDDPLLLARIIAFQGMNEADRGHHEAATDLLGRSVQAADAASGARQAVWGRGLAARSQMLLDENDRACDTAVRCIDDARSQNWIGFLPWPQAIHAELLSRAGAWSEARAEAEQAFALACELGDPWWEGMSARALAMIASHDGDGRVAWAWIVDARRRCDRVADPYVWVSCYIGLGQLELAVRHRPELVPTLAAQLYRDACRCDLPEFMAWALVRQMQPGRPETVRLAQRAARGLDSRSLRRAVAAHGQLAEAGVSA